MSDTNPLIDKKLVTAGEASIRMVPMEGRDSYLVEIVFPLDALRVYCSKWVNPMRCAFEAAEKALDALKCACYTAELNEGKPYEKPVDKNHPFHSSQFTEFEKKPGDPEKQEDP